MKKFVFLLASMTMLLLYVHAQQEYEDGLLWVVPTTQEAFPDSSGKTSVSAINNLFNEYGVFEYETVMPFAKTPILRKVHQLSFTGNDTLFMQELEQNYEDYFEKIKRISTPKYVYDPYDTFWRYQLSGHQNWMWHLERTDASAAWDISRGSENIKITVSDRGFDITHPDLSEKAYPPYEPRRLKKYSSLIHGQEAHGTGVASFAAAATGTETEQAGGNLVSMGFNCKMYFAFPSLASCLYASTVLETDVLTISWYGNCEKDETGTDSTIIKEILDNGTVITAAAGNGHCGGCYNDSKYTLGCDTIPPDFQYFSPLYPFSPKYDERIICVTGTDTLDFMNYTVYPNTDSSYDATWSYFREVDVCSPGHNLTSATQTLIEDDTGNIKPDAWPYFSATGGTSFATPIVAGLAGLIKSIDPCFTPSDVQYFIKSTTDTIADGYLYEDDQGNSQTGTGRINAYAALSLAQQYANNAEVHIRNNEVWTNDTTVSSIFIHDGGQLTIQSEVSFVHDTSGIIVDAGGKLIIDGGHLTSCGLCWKGIEVWGRPDTTQNFTGIQGHLEIKNSSVIENTLYGVTAYKIGDLDHEYTGGIIEADDSYFINNVSSVSFLPYENMHPYDPGTELNNMSSFDNCTFSIDNPKVYYHTNLHDSTILDHKNSFVNLTGIKGVDFIGCDFKNRFDAAGGILDTNISVDDYYIGILAFDADFRVLEKCLVGTDPCDSVKPSSFSKLRYGVKALSYMEPNLIEISNSSIWNCKTGIYLSGTNNSIINGNTMELVDVDEFAADSTYFREDVFAGIYLDGCTGFTVEENTIYKKFVMGEPTYNIGIVINNSGTEFNEIYNNQIEKMYVGILAQNQNRGLKGDGLCLKCNDLDNNEYDIAVTGDSTCSLVGIARYQGSPANDVTAPANNTFTDSSDPLTDIYNDGERIDYYHTYDQDDKKLEPIHNSSSVYKYPNYQLYDKDSSCPSSFDSGGTPGKLESEIMSSEIDLDSQTSELSSLVDGGDTDNLNTEVQGSTPPEAMEVQDQLLSDSPYLSDTVMKSAIVKENVLPNAMIRDMMVANPQSAKSEDVLDELDMRFDPMADYMMQQIMQGNNSLSAKEKLESKIAGTKLERQKAYRGLINYYKRDTSSIAGDSLNYWLQELNTLQSEYALAFEHLKAGEISLMDDVLNEIPNTYDLSGELQFIHNDYLLYFDLLADLEIEGKSIENAGQGQIDTLLLLAAYDQTNPGIYARNALIQSGEINYNEPYILPASNKSVSVMDPFGKQTESGSILKVFPNPAKDYIIVEYLVDIPVTDQENQNMTLVMIDGNGKLLKSFELNYSQDQLVIPTENLNSGIYIFNLYVYGKLEKTTKFTIVK